MITVIPLNLLQKPAQNTCNRPRRTPDLILSEELSTLTDSRKVLAAYPLVVSV